VFAKLKDMIAKLSDDGHKEIVLGDDKNFNAAVLMVHIIAADGKVTPEEEAKLLSVLETHYDMSAKDAAKLAEQAKLAQSEAIDLHAFTSVLKKQMSEVERLGLVEDLWEMVYADGELHEFEDNLVWRVAELVGISSDRRMALKRLVRDRAIPS